MSIDSKSHVGFPVDEMYELGYPIKPQRCRLTKFWLSPVDRNIKWQVSPEVNLTVPVLNWSGFFSCIFVHESQKIQNKQAWFECHIITYLLTSLARAILGEYWTCSVHTATASGQYFPLRPSRSVSKKLVLTETQQKTSCRSEEGIWFPIFFYVERFKILLWLRRKHAVFWASAY